jgi:glycosyltransferase involved in cell wall biosynthesis
MKVLFLVTDDWYFVSHRLNLARGLIERGYEVAVITNDSHAGASAEIRACGITLYPFTFARTVGAQWKNWLRVRVLRKLYEEVSPDIIHHVSFLPILYGSRAARSIECIRVVNAVTGLGHIYSIGGWRGRFARMFMDAAYRQSMNGASVRVIFQNESDCSHLVDNNLCSSAQACVIPGSGVDVARFTQKPLPARRERPIVLHASRMLESKGVRVSIAASQALHAAGFPHELILAGKVHPDNPSSLSEVELLKLTAIFQGRWLGHVSDIAGLIAESEVVVLPTLYREGVPMVLLEAAAVGRPMISSNMPGCTDIVKDGETGVVVERGDVDGLARAIMLLLEDRRKREQYGQAARSLACRYFSIGLVLDATIAQYECAVTQR